MRRFVIAAVGILGLGLSAFGRQDEKEKAKEAEEKLKAFKEELKKCKVEGDYVNAINNHLGTVQHPKILAELRNWLPKPSQEIMMAAADLISKYKKDKTAAEALFKAALNQKDRSICAKLIELSSDTECKEMVRSYCALFKHKDLEIAESGISACAKVRSKDAIEPLIGFAKELEGIRDDAAGNSPTGGMKDKDGNPLPTAPNQQEKEQERKRKLLPSVHRALGDITGENFKSSKDWQGWWAKNRATFKEKA